MPGLCHLDFRAAMEAEHCSRPGYDHVFTTTNYRITSTPKIEWEIVTGQQRCTPESMREGRRIPKIDHLLGLDTAKNAGLTWPEVAAVVLYTGPMVVQPLIHSLTLDALAPDLNVSLRTTTLHLLAHE